MAGKRGMFAFLHRFHIYQLKPALTGLPNICAYSMSKFAVRGLVQSLGELVFSIQEILEFTFGIM